MPSVSISSVTQTSASWIISDLSNPFISQYYDYCYITYNGQSSSPDYPPASGTGRTSNGSISGLSPSTSYSVNAYAVVDGITYSAGSTSFSTPAPPTPTMNPMTTWYRDQGGIWMQWATLSGANYYYPEYRLSGSSSWSSFGSTSGSYAYLSVGTYGVAYDFRIRASLTSGGYSNYSFVTSATTEPKQPSISGQVTNGTTFTVYASGMLGNWNTIIVERLSSTGSLIDTRTITPSGNQYVQWLNMPAGTNNKFRARSEYSGLYSPYSNEIVLQNLRPENFSWTNVKQANQPFNVLASEWNGLTTRINDFRVYRGKTAYGFTTVTTGNTFYASVFNQAVNAILGINNPSPTISPPSIKQSGNTITAADINRLRDSINSVE
ncbi:hypothetical protein ACFQZE_07470 [Paenibacillus sp. GCM10027627]|uniref:hypothetical protein n=1 Tax=unclassified Paenibacillus TaxID=185978 RepID=UPI00363A9405